MVYKGNHKKTQTNRLSQQLPTMSSTYNHQNFQKAKKFITNLSNSFIASFNKDQIDNICELTNDDGVLIALPIFEADKILPKSVTSSTSSTSCTISPNKFQISALKTWNEFGILLVKDLLDQKCLSQLHEHAIQFLEKPENANAGDHFRTTDPEKLSKNALGKEGRGWNQRKAIRETNPELLKILLAKFKMVQSLIFGNISTTTEFQFNATYSPEIGHIHIDRPAGFTNLEEATNTQLEILKSMNKLSFQAAFYTENTPRNKGSTGFLPGSHKMLNYGINPIALYSSEEGKEYLKSQMYHGDIPRNVTILFQSSVLHRTGRNEMNQTRIAYLVQCQLSCLVRMEGNVNDQKLLEYAIMLDHVDDECKQAALDSLDSLETWAKHEIYNNYPFPCDLSSPNNKPSDGYLTPKTLIQRLSEDFGVLKVKSIEERVEYFRNYFRSLAGEEVVGKKENEAWLKFFK